MYAGTIFEYVDLSEIPVLETVSAESPFFVAAFSSEKGTEKPIVIDGADFYKMFATPDASQSNGYFLSFEKHGQPLIQAARIIDSGAKLYAKRVVAKDAELANIVIHASVTATQKQKVVKDTNGNDLLQYWTVDESGKKIETSEATNADGTANEPVMIDTADITYSASSRTGVASIAQVADIENTKTTASYIYTVTSAGLVGGTYALKDVSGVLYEFTIDGDLVEGDKLTWDGKQTQINYTASGIEKSTSITVVSATAVTEIKPVITQTFPILIVADNGRGESKKKIKIVPNYEYSKDLDYMIYNFQVIEEGSILDSKLISLDSSKQYLSKNISISSQFSSVLSQIKTKFMEDSFAAFVQNIADITGKTYDEIISVDILNGKNRKGENIDYVNITSNSFDLQYIYGTLLQGGSNGSFGTHPFGSEAYIEEMVEFFNGTYTDDIYDVDNLKFDFIVDANYPEAVKTAIENFVMFREDCFFFCDFGVGITNFLDVRNMVQESRHADSKFVAYYHNSYDIIDPYTQRQITVTIMYDIANLLVDHYFNGRIRPFAGQLYGITFPNAIENTINFIPKIIPGTNQKQLMNDIRVNYVTYYDGVLTMDSEYTSQNKHTQFSYINNILATQEVIKAIRTRCPKIRYSFINQEGLVKYKEDVENNVLNKYSGNFETLELVYLGDSTYEANKIFYAGINVRFRDFIQTEIFKVYALL